MSDVGLYAYALTRQPDAGGPTAHALADVGGLAGRPVALVDHVGLSAVVSEVDLLEFGEEGLARNLEDLGWLEAVATGHDTVVRAVAALAPVAPLRLATVFLTEHGLRDRLTEWAGPAERALERLEGAREWSVKAYVDEPKPVPPGHSGAGAATGLRAETGAGAAYLRARREAGQHRDRLAERGREVADTIHQRLGATSTASRRLAAQDRRLTGHSGEMVLNGAYLVEDARLVEFEAEVAGLTPELAVRVELGGPWAPYSFATLDDP